MVPANQGPVTPEKNSDRRAWTTRNIHLLRQPALSSGGTDEDHGEDHVNNGEDRAQNEEDWMP